MSDKGKGRIHAPDERDRNYPLRDVTPTPALLPRYRHYRTGPVLDQGFKPHCVGFAWKQWLSSAPLMTRTGPAPDVIYHAAQRVDEWPGEDYAGTSVRAGARVLQALGHIQQYRWAFDIAVLRQWILSGSGSVVLGTNWYRDMDTPDRYGMVRVAGRIEGGHAYLCIGYNDIQGVFTCMNSWGAGWGQRGRFRISGEDLQRLLHEHGEACCGIECVVTV